MFNRLPGAMLKERHMHECRLGCNCGPAPLHDTAAAAESHRLFNPAPPEVGLKAERAAVIARITRLERLERLTANRQLLRIEKPSNTNCIATPGELTVA